MNGGVQDHQGRRLIAHVLRPALAIAVCGVTFAATMPTSAQQPPAAPQVADQQGPQTPGAQGQRGRGRGPAGPVGPPRQTAPVDLTGPVPSAEPLLFRRTGRSRQTFRLSGLRNLS